MYIVTLNECLFEMTDVHYPDGWTLQEDDSLIHKSKLSKSWKESQNLNLLECPAHSPDLNPKENICGVLKQRLLRSFH